MSKDLLETAREIESLLDKLLELTKNNSIVSPTYLAIFRVARNMAVKRAREQLDNKK